MNIMKERRRKRRVKETYKMGSISNAIQAMKLVEGSFKFLLHDKIGKADKILPLL